MRHSRTFRALALMTLAAGLAQAAPALVILVRHAERAGEMGDDPNLTAAGKQRAEELVRVLAAWKASGGKLQALFASEMKRTQETLAPLAAGGIKVTVVPAADTAVLVKKILAVKGGIVVVAGHSNTLPGVIQALGGPTGITIDDNEFDRLFALTGAGGHAALVGMRYGSH